MLNEKEKEKLEELEKEIYKKDLFIRDKLLEMNDLKNQIDILKSDLFCLFSTFIKIKFCINRREIK